MVLLGSNAARSRREWAHQHAQPLRLDRRERSLRVLGGVARQTSPALLRSSREQENARTNVDIDALIVAEGRDLVKPSPALRL